MEMLCTEAAKRKRNKADTFSKALFKGGWHLFKGGWHLFKASFQGGGTFFKPFKAAPLCGSYRPGKTTTYCSRLSSLLSTEIPTSGLLMLMLP